MVCGDAEVGDATVIGSRNDELFMPGASDRGSVVVWRRLPSTRRPLLRGPGSGLAADDCSLFSRILSVRFRTARNFTTVQDEPSGRSVYQLCVWGGGRRRGPV